LLGKALAWVEAMSSNLDIGLWTFKDSETHLRAVFDHPNHRGKAGSSVFGKGIVLLLTTLWISGRWLQTQGGMMLPYREYS